MSFNIYPNGWPHSFRWLGWRTGGEHFMWGWWRFNGGQPYFAYRFGPLTWKRDS